MAEFFAMGGHGFYIWSSYGVTFLFLAIEVFLLMRKKKTMMQRLARIARMNKK